MIRDALKSQGYCVLPDILSEQDIADLRCAIEDTIERVARALLTPHATSEPGLPLEQRFDKIAGRDQSYSIALYQAVMADTHRDPRVTALIEHPRLTPRVMELLAPLIRTGEVIRPRAAIPAYPSRRSPWHQDVSDLSDGRDDLNSVRLACWMPLSDVSEGDGALEVVSRTWNAPLDHVRGRDGHMAIPENALLGRHRAHPAVGRGDVLILDRFVPHRTGAIRADRARWAFTMWVKGKRA